MRLLWSLILAVMSAPATALADGPPKVLAAWSQISGETDSVKAGALTPPVVAMRWVTDAPDCTDFSVSYDDASGAGKASAVPVVARRGVLAITVCDVAMADTWLAAHLNVATGPATLESKINYGSYYSASLDEIFLDAAHSHPSPWVSGPSDSAAVSVAGPASIGANGALKMVTLGDTGCRGWTVPHPSRGQGRYDQHCDGGGWPLDWLSTEAAKHDPDLVIHVGDYRYFFEDDRIDNWKLWQKDFFPAAQPLLLAAPWAFTRGNHEGCDGAQLPYGGGYFQLFGNSAGESCPSVDGGTTDGKPNMFAKPWFFDVQPGGTTGGYAIGAGAHRFVMVDVNSYKGRFSFNSAEAEAHFSTAQAMVAKGPASNWWVAHTPAVELLYYGGAEHGGDWNVLNAMSAATAMSFCGTGSGEGRCKPSQILLGHQHLYQEVTFPEPIALGNGSLRYPSDGLWLFPRQMIVGHGGTRIDNGGPAPSGHQSCNHTFSDFTIGNQSPTGIVTTVEHHGALIWSRTTQGSEDQSGWTPEYLWSGDPTLHPAPPATDGATRRSCL